MPPGFTRAAFWTGVRTTHHCTRRSGQPGESLPIIGKLLDHTEVQTTARYAHLAVDPVKAAAEVVSLSGTNAVTVVSSHTRT